jgi:hypothetical protein
MRPHARRISVPAVSVGVGHGRVATASNIRPLRPRAAFDEFARLAGLDEIGRAMCPSIAIPAGARRPETTIPAARALVVEAGVVVVRVTGGDGWRSLIVARYTAGALIVPPGPGDQLQSLTDAWLTAIPSAIWERLVEVPAAATRLVAGLEQSFRRQRQGIRPLSGVRHVDRVRSQLLDLAAGHGRVCRDGIRLDLPLTHDLIADMVGCARETVTRALDELEREGFVTRRGRFYHLLVAPEAISA